MYRSSSALSKLPSVRFLQLMSIGASPTITSTNRLVLRVIDDRCPRAATCRSTLVGLPMARQCGDRWDDVARSWPSRQRA